MLTLDGATSQSPLNRWAEVCHLRKSGGGMKYEDKGARMCGVTFPNHPTQSVSSRHWRKRAGAVTGRDALTLAGILAGWFSSMSLLRCKIHMRLSGWDLAWGQSTRHQREYNIRRTVLKRQLGGGEPFETWLSYVMPIISYFSGLFQNTVVR